MNDYILHKKTGKPIEIEAQSYSEDPKKDKIYIFIERKPVQTTPQNAPAPLLLQSTQNLPTKSSRKNIADFVSHQSHMSKQFLISIHKNDRTLDYSRLEEFLSGQNSQSPLLTDQHILIAEIESAQHFRDEIQKYLHRGDRCSVAVVLDYAFRATTGLPQ